MELKSKVICSVSEKDGRSVLARSANVYNSLTYKNFELLSSTMSRIVYSITYNTHGDIIGFAFLDKALYRCRYAIVDNLDYNVVKSDLKTRLVVMNSMISTMSAYENDIPFNAVDHVLGLPKIKMDGSLSVKTDSNVLVAKGYRSHIHHIKYFSVSNRFPHRKSIRSSNGMYDSWRLIIKRNGDD